MAQSFLQKAYVKQVLSGDTVVIRGKPQGGPPALKTISLAYLNAPKLARNDKNVDELFAWLSRELLRTKLVGKEIEFSIESKSPQNREYGFIYLPSNDSNESENINESVVAAGLADVRRIQGSFTNENYTKLLNLEEAARSQQRGKFCSSPSAAHLATRDVVWKIEDPVQFVESLKKAPVDAIIEHIRDGSSYRACILPIPGFPPVFYMIYLNLSGLRSPGFRQEEDGQIASEYAEEARYFAETRILQRQVAIKLETVSGQSFVGSVLHPRGNIGQLLLQNGLAYCVDWSMSVVSTEGGSDVLRNCEKDAKTRKLRIWKNYEPPSIFNANDFGLSNDDKHNNLVAGSGISIQGKVIEVGNADNITIKCAHDNVERKFFLASIRPPRFALSDATPGERSRMRPLYAIPHMFEAREFLRKKLVGKRVTVLLDYIQPALQTSQEDKKCATVMIGNKNAAEALVSKGLATVVRYKAGEDKRSRVYDQLLAAEAVAIKKAVGVHNKNEQASMKVNELSGDAAKSKQFLPFLKRGGRLEGVVEYVASGSRMRIFIPRETCVITFLLAGIDCPKPVRKLANGDTEGSDVFGDECLAYAKEHILQREVSIEVENIDKVGNFIGWLFTSGGDDANFSVTLVERGLAATHFTAERSPYFHNLTAAEEKAKSAKLGMWGSESFCNSLNETARKEEEALQAPTEKTRFPGVVMSVKENLTVTILPKDMTNAFGNLLQEVSCYLDANPPVPHSYTPQKQGELCFAKFSIDQTWYRAKVLKLHKLQGKLTGVRVLFIDFGNEEVIEKGVLGTSLCQMPIHFSKTSPLAKQFILAGVKLPPEEDDQMAATLALREDLANSEVTYVIEYGDKARILRDLDKKDQGYILIRDGLALADANPHLTSEVRDRYIDAQLHAKKERRYIWKYGDFTGNDPL